MKIHGDFTGGNISVVSADGEEIRLENQIRDTFEDWFYWAFCVEGAENRTLTFKMQKNRLGYYGPAVSRDLENWTWLDSGTRDSSGDSFTYTFGPNEGKVYFAHDMLYHPKRFSNFAEELGLPVFELCKGYKGSSIPAVCFGEGDTSIILTARHHACESTGSYVLEGVIRELFTAPIEGVRVLCVPFVDYEGVVRGDQGKSRSPHDHNRDYVFEGEPIYPECRAIMEYAEKFGSHYAVDFHSPWHLGDSNDLLFVVKNRINQTKVVEFSNILENSVSDRSMKYFAANDYPAETGWNTFNTSFGCYMSTRPENCLALSFETAYFGVKEDRVSQEKLTEFGRCFAAALKEYIRGRQN